MADGEEEQPEMTGYLVKSGGANMLLGTRFNKRFFALTGSKIYYYTSETKLDEPRGVINLEADTKLSKEEASGGKEATKFQIMTKERVYVLIAPDEKSLMEWLNALKAALQKLRGAKAGASVSAGLENMSIASLQGFLMKKKAAHPRKRSSITAKLKSHTSNGGWQKRYFVLAQGRLRWMLEDATGEVLNFVNLKEPGVGVKLLDDTDRPFCFRLTCGSGVRLLSAETEEERQQWITALEKNIVVGEVHQQGTTSSTSPLLDDDGTAAAVKKASYEDFVGAELADTGMELQPTTTVATAKSTGGMV